MIDLILEYPYESLALLGIYVLGLVVVVHGFSKNQLPQCALYGDSKMIDYLALFVHPDDWVWYHWVQYFVACYVLWVFMKAKHLSTQCALQGAC